MKVDQEQEACFRIEEKFPMEYADRKIRMPEETEERESFQVAKHHLDINHHVNNASTSRWQKNICRKVLR